MQLDGKTVVLTGAAGGIGSLLSSELRGEGATVIGVDRADCLQCDEAILADLSSRSALAELCETLAARRIDVLVNLAGMQYFGPFERQAPDDLWTGYVVNLIAPAALIRGVLPQMQARGDGQIVNIGSVMGLINFPHFAAYSSAKAGLRGLSEGLRRELRGTGIALTHVSPRAVNTSFNNETVGRFMAIAKMKADSPERVARIMARAIARRRPEVVIGAAERMFVHVNGLFPRIVDAGLASQTAKARTLFE